MKVDSVVHRKDIFVEGRWMHGFRSKHFYPEFSKELLWWMDVDVDCKNAWDLGNCYDMVHLIMISTFDLDFM